MESEKTAPATAPARRRVAKVPAHPVALVTGASGDLGGAMAQTLARAGMAVGIAGLFIEAHEDPAHAKCDGPSALPLDKLNLSWCR